MRTIRLTVNGTLVSAEVEPRTSLADVRSIEGFAADPTMQIVREAFHEAHGLQCGFCTPGMLITVRDVLLRKRNLDEAQIRVELSGNLCRCTGYAGIVRAVQLAQARLAALPTTSAQGEG